MREMEFDWESTDSDEPVGLFGLHSMEPCLVTANAEGLVDVTFNKYRWAHIDNDTDG